MRSTRWAIWWMIGGFLLFGYQTGYAEEMPSVQSGTYLTAADDAWEEMLGATFPAKEAIVLTVTSFELTEQSFEQLRNSQIPNPILEALHPLEHHAFQGEDGLLATVGQQIGPEQTEQYQAFIVRSARNEKRFVLYGQDKPVWNTSLSVFEHGQERILWSIDDYLFHTEAGTSNPTLTGGYFNANAQLDLLLTYFSGTGLGAAAESNTTRMVLLLDEQKVMDGDFELSAYEIERCNPFIDDQNCQGREYQKEAEFLLIPALNSHDAGLYFWTATKEGGDEATPAYQMTEVRISNYQVFETKTIAGERDHIAEMLRSVVLTSREHGEIPLFFSSDMTLFDEHTWFDFWGD